MRRFLLISNDKDDTLKTRKFVESDKNIILISDEEVDGTTFIAIDTPEYYNPKIFKKLDLSDNIYIDDQG
jgi:hypothetical protein